MFGNLTRLHEPPLDDVAAREGWKWLSRRWLPPLRLLVFWLTGFLAGIFVATSIAALAWGYAPPDSLRLAGSLAALVAVVSTIIALRFERRRRQRRRHERDVSDGAQACRETSTS